MEKLINEAIKFAVEKHKYQNRKATPWPYIVHIYDVMQILQDYDANNETIIAGILHDTVEDTNTTLQEIEDKFGHTIRVMVDILSENKSLPYMKRKLIQAERLERAPIQVKMVKCADCLANLRNIKNDLKLNPNAWSKFNSSKENIQMHYSETINAIAELESFEIYKQLKENYEQVFTKKKCKAELIQDYCNDCRHMKRLPDLLNN